MFSKKGKNTMDLKELKKYRKKNEVTQQRMADLIGISRSTYKMIENGTIAPTPSFIEGLKKAQDLIEKEKLEVVEQVIEIRGYNRFGKVVSYQKIIDNEKTREAKRKHEEKLMKELEEML